MTDPDDIKRESNGRFQPGVSGNLSGRPKSATTLLREKIAEDLDEVVKAVVFAAKNGDMLAAKLILDRLIPALRPTAAMVNLQLPADATPVNVAESLLRSVACGQISPDSAAQLLGATAQFSKILEVEELRDRINAIEKSINPPKPKQR